MLIGELTPFSGDRLQEIFEMSITQYLKTFDHVDLCHGKRWCLEDAIERAEEIFFREEDGSMILLGAKVTRAFRFSGIKFEPFSVYYFIDTKRVIAILPHPVRLWNVSSSKLRAKKVLRDVIRESICYGRESQHDSK